MRFRTATVILLSFASAAIAQNTMSDTLRKGILAEDAEQKLPAAIKEYQAVLNQFNDERQVAATALFRMAECYRKQGQNQQAIAAYRRVLKDFGDQAKLAQQSRTTLTAVYEVPYDPLQPQNTKAQAQEQAAFDARARYRATLEEEENIVERQLSLVRQRQNAGVEGALSSGELEQKIQELKREIAAFDAGFVKTRYTRELPANKKGNKMRGGTN